MTADNENRRPFTYVVEHMEEELGGWPEIEYRNIMNNVGKDRFWVTCVQPTLLASLPQSLAPPNGPFFTTDSIQDMPNVDKSRVLLLDPESTTPLTTEDGENFDFLLFGGILGDDPPKDRTKELRDMGFATRHLGPVQMTTDTAVLASQLVLESKETLESIQYVDRPEIQLGKKEFVELPFRYIKNKQGQPTLPPGLLQHLKEQNEMPLI